MRQREWSTRLVLEIENAAQVTPCCHVNAPCKTSFLRRVGTDSRKEWLPKVPGFQPERIDMQIGLVHIARLDHRRFGLPAIEAAATMRGVIATAGLKPNACIQSGNLLEIGG